jgi:hypothetical protein
MMFCTRSPRIVQVVNDTSVARSPRDSPEPAQT